MPLDVLSFNSRYLNGEEERKVSYYFSTLIQEAGILLRIPQQSIATAQAIALRFYFKQNIGLHNHETILPAALFLACKLEEHHRKMKDVISVFHYVIMKNRGKKEEKELVLNLNSFEYQDKKQALIEAERLLLKELGF